MPAPVTALSNAFKLELLKGNHDFDNDTFRVALIKENPSGTYDATTVAYTDLGSDQASGTGYTGTFDTISTGAWQLLLVVILRWMVQLPLWTLTMQYSQT